MGKFIVEHEEFGPVLFDTETQTYEYTSDKQPSRFNLNGKSEIYFENITDFLESNHNQAVVPFVCTNTGLKGRRTFCELTDWENIPLQFFNVEIIDSNWHPNQIENMSKGKCYFVIVRKHNKALNDFLILSSISIQEAIRKREALAR